MLRRHADHLAAAGLLAASLVQVIAFPIAPVPVGVVVAVLSMVPVAFRRGHPVAAALVGSAAWVIPTDGYLVLGYVAAFLLFYALGAHCPDLRRVVAVVVWAGALSIVAAALQDAVAGEYFGGLTAVVAPAAVGVVVRRQRELERHTAVVEERARIARELHDVVAHNVSLIAVQSDAASAALDRDPDLARTPLTTIHGAAQGALVEMRRLLGALREDDDAGGLAPQPGLAELPGLVERTQAAGTPVTLEVSGEPRPLPPGLDLTAYRIVQEALTNVVRHAPGAPALVRLAWSPQALEIAVSNPARDGREPPAEGHGLVGMRERVRLHDGRIEAGRRNGTFVVDAVLPL